MKRQVTFSLAAALCLAVFALLSYVLGWWGERYRVAVGMTLADCVDAAARVMEPHSSSIDFGAAHWYGEEDQPLDVVVYSIHSRSAARTLLLVVTRPMEPHRKSGELAISASDPSWKVAQLIVCPQLQERMSGGGNYWQAQLQGAEYPESLTRRELRGLCE